MSRFVWSDHGRGEEAVNPAPVVVFVLGVILGASISFLIIGFIGGFL